MIFISLWEFSLRKFILNVLWHHFWAKICSIIFKSAYGALMMKSYRRNLFFFQKFKKIFGEKSFCFIETSIIKVPIFTIYKKNFFDESDVDFFRRNKICWGINLFLFSVVTSVGWRKVRTNMLVIPEHIEREKLKYS